MYRAIKTVRLLCAIVIAWQLIEIVPTLKPVYYGRHDLSGGFVLGTAFATLTLKLLAVAFFILLYRMLGHVQADIVAALVNPKLPFYAGWKYSVRGVARKRAITGAALLIAGLTALLVESNPHLQKVALDDECTPNFVGLQTAYPNLRGYTKAELFEKLSAAPKSAEVLEYLMECRWNRVRGTALPALYIDKRTILVHPGNRRSAQMMMDFSAPLQVETSDVSRQFRSSVASIVVDCTQGGIAILALQRMSGDFGHGTIVSQESRHRSAATVPLGLHSLDAPENIAWEAICNYRP